MVSEAKPGMYDNDWMNYLDDNMRGYRVILNMAGVMPMVANNIDDTLK